ncbi:ATP-dependent DNA helicase DinG [Nocardioides cavernae]|uniref:ATP-dependent helicase DinG n=1 Tax=Nocardioides cavernae TaxID=1921566 RepID=A0A7Y9H0E5_9ACTN|nr:ATP-dependent DNA helicase [Nocardioides cavernae]NYE35676.1 ATP-dependent DNA helicase DinG [Nocardioides cavernae]
MPETSTATAPVAEVLAKAVTGLGGQQRDGQVQMATEVAEAMEEGRHLLVQAGTGTGKSLGYLVPAMLHDKRVVVATATLALQHQLVERDLPRLVEAVKGVPGLDTSYAVLKGRSNYACLHRIRAGVPDDQGTLVDVPMGSMAEKVLELRAWAEEESEQGGSGERDNAPRHTDREWRQVAVNHRECLGATKCPFGAECFAELAKEKAQRSHLIVTNHSLLAIDAIEDVPMIPDYDTVVIDEAHELTARVTQAATDELAVADIERAARRSTRWTEAADGDPAGDLEDAAQTLAEAFEATPPGRIDQISTQLSDALVLVRDAARTCLSAYPRESGGDGEGDAGRTQAKGMVQEVFVNAERMAAGSQADVLWLGEARDRFPARLHVAPLQVWGPMRDKLLTDKTVVFTSATLMLGGEFGAVATSLGLKPTERIGHQVATTDADDALPWKGIDVGSPFDYGQQSILYVARHLPQPGRDGLGPAQLDEICDLVDALDGRTLGLFSSRRAAETAAEAVRARLPHLTTLAQGDAQLPELAKQFVEDPHTCLFGTLSLWQGLDVPGDTCQLVIIDRIPFPRPDDPLMSARAKAADDRGGNGFMEVSATHAALLMAQGAGRLIRTTTDRGIVAVLDPRLETARYGRFLKASLPPMWSTTDPALVRQALKRLGQG